MNFSILIYDSDGQLGPALEQQLSHSSPCKIRVFARSGELLNRVNHSSPDLVVICQSEEGERYLRLCGVLHRKESKSKKPFPILMLPCRDDAQFAEISLSAGATEVMDFGSSAEQIQYKIERLIESVPANYAAQAGSRHSQTLPPNHGLRVMVAEDAKLYQLFYRSTLEEMGCEVSVFENGKLALDALDEGDEPDLILTDINMPVMDGQTFIHHVRQDGRFDRTPIVVATTIEQMDTLNHLFDMGVNDYFTKPVNGKVFSCRISAHLHTRLMLKREQGMNLKLIQLNSQLKDFNQKLDLKVKERTRELYETQMDVIHKLAKACEYKDDDTGNHIHRVGYFTEALALACGVEPDLAEEMRYGSLMHDIGKMGIPDSILQKPGRLTPEERVIMETHTTLGEQILGDRPFFKQAVLIAGGHHEKWDGSGYPRKLVGEDIPLAARIVAITDVFDALLSRRSYKEPKTLEETKAILAKGRGSHFDPTLIDLFFELIEQGSIGKIMQRFPYE